ncbi:MAG: TIGR00159 family protein [Ruminococcaceae bacterium]|nr:TIGR00159 family protein [Oscillospiraceae bacterium]
MEYIKDFFYYIGNQFTSMGINDIFDILIVAVIFYYIYVFIRDRRAGKLVSGVVFILLMLVISSFLNMRTVSFLLQNVVQVGMLAVFILFQPELRSMLEKMGVDSISRLNSIGEQKELQQTISTIDEISKAAQELSNEKTGALMVIERATRLGDEVRSGVVVDAEITTFLIKNIFFNKAPLHDGAMIIRNNRILACGCFLPLSSNRDIIKDLGTRHRAAIGISESSDAIVVVVSEETGAISLAEEGNLVRNFTRATLKEELMERMIDPSLLKKKKDRDDEDEEKNENSFISKLIDRIKAKKDN